MRIIAGFAVLLVASAAVSGCAALKDSGTVRPHVVVPITETVGEEERASLRSTLQALPNVDHVLVVNQQVEVYYQEGHAPDADAVRRAIHGIGMSPGVPRTYGWPPEPEAGGGE